MANPTYSQAYAGKDILMRNNKLHVIVKEDPIEAFVYLIKDERTTDEAETTARGWQRYTYATARTTFDTTMPIV